jgi:hypothetical protein
MSVNGEDNPGLHVFGVPGCTDKDFYKLPERPDWKWEPKGMLAMQKDAALAAKI